MQKYPYGTFDYQATTRGHVTTHQQLVHEGKKYPCDTSDYQASKRGNLTRQKKQKQK
jgi:hypothetical protein